MHTVKVKRSELLATLKENRAKHRELFLAAQQGYRQDVITELDKMLKDAREGKNIRTVLSLPAPQDHTTDYDRAIRMLEMSVDDTVDIMAHEFDQYVMDNWQWKAQFLTTNEGYAAKVGFRKPAEV